MTARETDYYRTIIDGAHLYGWLAAHFRPAQTKHGWRTAVQGDGAGFPDMVLAHPRAGVLFLEVKRDAGGKLRADQERWADVLTSGGVPYLTLWVPTQLPDLWHYLENRSRPRPLGAPQHPLVADVMEATWPTT